MASATARKTGRICECNAYLREINNGALLESTGDVFGNSGINRIDLKTGHVQTLLDAGRRYFGEGLTEFGGRLYQMTYTEHRVFVFDPKMKPLHRPKGIDPARRPAPLATSGAMRHVPAHED